MDVKRGEVEEDSEKELDSPTNTEKERNERTKEAE